MASSGATLVRPVVTEHNEMRAADVARPGYNVALGYLRGSLALAGR